MKIQLPRDGDTRIKFGFLWLPRTISGETRWLEYATWKQRYTFYGYDSIWVDVEWTNENEK